MTTQLVYVYPTIDLRRYYPLAARFAKTYQQFPAGYEHQLVVICNGRQPRAVETDIFKSIEHKLVVHDNSGWDIGAYQRFADQSKAELLICLGAPCFFYREGWMSKMVDAVYEFGPGLFGSTAYGGNMLHVRTTCFWMPPELLRSYPAYIGSSRKSRYEFEHGATSFTRHVLDLGFPCVMSTWKGNFPRPLWHNNAPDKNQILVRDQHIH